MCEPGYRSLIDMTSVLDSDGEFLLIEAAEALPSWVKPSNSENRVRFAFVCLVRRPVIYSARV